YASGGFSRRYTQILGFFRIRVRACTARTRRLSFRPTTWVDPGGPPLEGPFFLAEWPRGSLRGAVRRFLRLAPGASDPWADGRRRYQCSQIEMNVAHERLPGLDRDRILAVVEPILAAHGVDGVELVWRTDRGERVLELTIERPEARIPGHG